MQTRKVIPKSIGQKEIQTRWGPKIKYYLFVENGARPYGTWSKAFALALKEAKGKEIEITFEEQGTYLNLITPEKFKGGSGKIDLILESLKRIEEKLDKVLNKAFLSWH